MPLIVNHVCAYIYHLFFRKKQAQGAQVHPAEGHKNVPGPPINEIPFFLFSTYHFPIFWSFPSPDAHHEGVDHGSQYRLQQQQNGSYWTLVSNDTMAIANGGLCLDGEEEGRDEAVDIVDAGRPRLVLQMVQITPGRREGERVRGKWSGADRRGC